MKDAEQYKSFKHLSDIFNTDIETLPQISHLWDEINAKRLNYKTISLEYIENYNLIERYAVSYLKYRLFSEFFVFDKV